MQRPLLVISKTPTHSFCANQVPFTERIKERTIQAGPAVLLVVLVGTLL